MNEGIAHIYEHQQDFLEDQQQESGVDEGAETDAIDRFNIVVSEIGSGAEIYSSLKELKKTFTDESILTIYVETNRGAREYVIKGPYGDIGAIKFIEGMTLSQLIGKTVNIPDVPVSIRINSITLSFTDGSEEATTVFNSANPTGNAEAIVVPVQVAPVSVTPSAESSTNPPQPEQLSEDILVLEMDGIEEKTFTSREILLGTVFTISSIPELQGQNFRVTNDESGGIILQAEDINHPGQWDDDLADDEKSHIKLEVTDNRYSIIISAKGFDDEESVISDTVEPTPIAVSVEAAGLGDVRVVDIEEGTAISIEYNANIQLKDGINIGPIIRFKKRTPDASVGYAQKLINGIWVAVTPNELESLDVSVEYTSDNVVISRQ